MGEDERTPRDPNDALTARGSRDLKARLRSIQERGADIAEARAIRRYGAETPRIPRSDSDMVRPLLSGSPVAGSAPAAVDLVAPVGVDEERLIAVLRSRDRMDLALLEDLERCHERLNARSEIEPPRHIVPDLCRWLNILEAITERNGSTFVGADRLRVMASRAASHLGYLAFRDLDGRQARYYYGLSRDFAEEARDSAELAVLQLRRQRLVAATRGFAAAVDLVESLGDLLNADSPSGLTAWRWGERARQEASLGHETSARRYLDLALNAAARDPERLNLFAPDKDSRWLARRPAYVALKLGHGDEAIRILEANRQNADPRLVRELIWNSIELAEAWVVEGALDNACDHLDGAIDLAVISEDCRALGFILDVRDKIAHHWPNELRLRAINERLTEAILAA